MFAWQVFDQKVEHLLRDEYRIKQVTKVVANTLEELAGKLEGVDPRLSRDGRRIQQGRAAERAVLAGRQGRPRHART